MFFGNVVFNVFEFFEMYFFVSLYCFVDCVKLFWAWKIGLKKLNQPN